MDGFHLNPFSVLIVQSIIKCGLEGHIGKPPNRVYGLDLREAVFEGAGCLKKRNTLKQWWSNGSMTLSGHCGGESGGGVGGVDQVISGPLDFTLTFHFYFVY